MMVLSRHICFLPSFSEFMLTGRRISPFVLSLFEDDLALVNILAAG